MFATDGPINLEELLDGIAFPVSTIEVMAYAEDQDPSEEAMELLRGLPENMEFDSFAELRRHLGLLALQPGNENIFSGEGMDRETLN